MTGPLVSILMAARNAADFIDDAIRSARAQTVTDIEIVVVEDGSTDDTPDIVHAHAAQDNRVRLIAGPRKGLSPVRNSSLRAARGRFAVILDSDDMLHPRHLELLLTEQARTGAEICATNMVEFAGDGDKFSTRMFAQGASWDMARSIGLDEFLRCGMIGGRNVSLGYLKPLFVMDFLRGKAISYDERLRIGEDFDLVLRAMCAGARYRFLPEATYYYRKHSSSTSHRLSVADLDGMIETSRGYVSADARFAAIMECRLTNLEGARRQVEALAAIKAGRVLEALRLAVPHRQARRLTLASLCESAAKRLPSRRASAEPGDPAHDRTLAELMQSTVLAAADR